MLRHSSAERHGQISYAAVATVPVDDGDVGTDAAVDTPALTSSRQTSPTRAADAGSGISTTGGGSELTDTEGFVADVWQYCNSSELSDLVLLVRCQEQQLVRQFSAHKFILAKSSEYFRTILFSANWAGPRRSCRDGADDDEDNDCGSPDRRSRCELVEDDACYHCFEQFLRFLYSGRVVINAASSIGLLRLADKYQVWSLRQLAEKYMIENAQPPNVGNALLWYTWARHLHLTDLAVVCFNTVCWNARVAATLDEFLDTDCGFLRDLLSTDRLVIDDEFAALQLLLRWLSVDDRFDQFADEMLRMIRFPMMSAKQLFELETSDLSERPASKELLSSLINRAYRFRSLCPWQQELRCPEFADSFYKPRSYLCLSVDSIKVGNTMRFGLQVDIRTQSGPVPNTNRDAEWKMVYQKVADSWTFKLLSQESSFPAGSGGVCAEMIVLCENSAGDFVNFLCAESFQFTRSSQVCQCQLDIRSKVHGSPAREVKNLHVLLRIMAPSA